MDRVGVLVRAHRHLLEAYSERTTNSLRRAFPLPLALPWLERLLVDNVAKELRKDALVIQRAAAPAIEPLQRQVMMANLLAVGKEIDRQFLANLGGAPLRILIQYERIEPIRRQRIECLLTGAERILAAWHATVSLRHAVRLAYPDTALDQLLLKILELYALETKVLGEAVRLPPPLGSLRQRMVGHLYQVMMDVARQLADETSARVGAEAGR